MDNDNKLGYCILENPFSKEKETLIFISLADSPSLSPEVMEKPIFEKVCKLLKELGFTQTEALTFENINNPKVSRELIQETLDDFGMSYNKNLEASIRKEIPSIKNKEALQKKDKDLLLREDLILDASHYLKTKSFSSIPLGSKYRIPSIGEDVRLYFYLFVEAELLENGDIEYHLNGDFYSKKGSPTKRFIKIVKADFKRIDRGNPRELFFESYQSYYDFIYEIDSLHSYKFTFTSKGVTGSNKSIDKIISIIDIYSQMNMASYITINLDSPRHFSQLITLSNEIKEKIQLSNDKTISTDFIIKKTESVVFDMKNKMIERANEEKYEQASIIKKIVNQLSNKIKWIKKLDKTSLSIDEYDDLMSFGTKVK